MKNCAAWLLLFALFLSLLSCTGTAVTTPDDTDVGSDLPSETLQLPSGSSDLPPVTSGSEPSPDTSDSVLPSGSDLVSEIEDSSDVASDTSSPEDEPSPDLPVEDPTPLTVTVSYSAKAVFSNGKTYTGLSSLPCITYTVKDAENLLGLSTESRSFSFGVAKNGAPHSITVENQKRFDAYGTDALAWDNQSEEKVLYLTFDCGYKYQDLVPRILDILEDKQVSAAFFCTLSYLKEAPEEVTRMIAEGHTVGNHSTSHPSDSAALSREALAKELLGVDNYLRVNFGYESRYFRFPTGRYSENALELVQSVGCRSVFWSIAHADWDPEDQPGEDVSFATVTGRLHSGAVILLHSTSPDNVAILSRFIDYARAQGYEFRTLDEYPGWS